MAISKEVIEKMAEELYIRKQERFFAPNDPFKHHPDWAKEEEETKKQYRLVAEDAFDILEALVFSEAMRLEDRSLKIKLD